MSTQFFFLLSLFPSLSLSRAVTLALSTLLPFPPNIQAGEAALPVENSVFSLLNFPSSGRFLTDSYTSAPLFLLNSLVGPCAGGTRKQHRAVRNHYVRCLTLPYDSQFPFCRSPPPSAQPSQSWSLAAAVQCEGENVQPEGSCQNSFEMNWIFTCSKSQQTTD